MTFAQVLEQVGGMGHFQVINVVLLCFPMVFMAAHNLLQNFTGAVPGHHCRIALNGTCDRNATESIDCSNLLVAFIPVDSKQKLQKCRRFVTTQWQRLKPNATSLEETEANTEPCLDGWIYEDHDFAATIVTEWDLVCDFRTFQQMAQSIYMAGVLAGAVVFGGLSDK